MVPPAPSALIVAVLLLAVSCSTKSSDQKPTGTPTDPVETCERLADVCRLKGTKLGVCTQNQAGTGFVCMSQH